MNIITPTDIQRRLLSMQDISYREFQSRLMPTVEKERVIGVRTPQLRALAKELAGSSEAEEFLSSLPHSYYEEDNLHAFLIEQIKDYDRCIEALESFLPYVNNWATCDCMTPKVLKKHLPELMERIEMWIRSDKTYTVRYAIGLLMKFYLDDAFEPDYLKMTADVRSEEYYVNMMRAWYFATALAKQYDAAVIYLEQRMLDDWTHHRTIQKAVESFRLSDERKAYLRSLK